MTEKIKGKSILTNTAPGTIHPRSIRVLMVEDVEDDVLLTLRELKRNGFDPFHERVESAAAMKKALEEKPWDIILCDYKMPHFTAPAAIALMKDMKLDIPIIIVSGNIGEETAIECMRLGAQDYIMKTNLSRLCPAITRELGEASTRDKKKQAEVLLSQQQAKYRSILENIEDGYYEVDLAGNFSFFNDSVCRILGYTEDELIGMNNRQFTDEDNAKGLFKAFNKVYRTGRPTKGFDWQVIRKDGSKRYIEASVSLLKDHTEKPIGFGGIIRDITERKDMETSLRDEEQKFRSLAEQSSDIILLINRKGTITYENKAVNEVLGYMPEERIGASSLDNIHPDDLKSNIEEFKILFKNADAPAVRTEVRIRHKNGSWRTFEEVATPLSSDHFVESVIINLRDITERKRVEEALRRSERYFKEITENSSDIIIIIDERGNIKYCSPAIERFAGYKPEEVIGENAFSFIHPDEIKRASSDLSSFILKKDNLIASNSFKVLHKDGSERYFNGVGKNLLDNPDIAGIVMNIRDITEQRKMEDKLHHEEKMFRAVAEQSSDIIVVINKHGIVTYENPALEKILGYRVEDRIGSSAFELIHPEDAQSTINSTKAFLSNEKITLGKKDIRFRHKNGSWRTFEVSVSNLVKDTVVESLIVNMHDITERKQAEIALKESEVKYRNIFENAMEGIYQVTLNGKFITANTTMARMAGYDSPEDFIESIQDIKTQLYVHPEDRDQFLKIIKTNGIVENFEVEFYKKDRSIFWVVLNAREVRDEQGNSLYNEGLVEDITMRKRAEEKLKESLERLKRAVNTTIQVLVTTLEIRDPYTAGHQSRSAHLACAIAAEMGLPQDKIDGIRMAGVIHDIGKLSIPVEILSKPSKLTTLEFSLIKEHSQSGFEMLKDIESPWPLAEIVHQHHERINGTGYPKNLKGDGILLEARILTVADVVEAMASHRPYRASLGIETALEEIEKNRGILYDENVVNACLRLFREKGYSLE